MNLVLSDIPLRLSLPEKGETVYVDLSKLSISNCIGCFGCWVKTPGRCVIRDDATKVYPLIAKSRRVIYVSRIYLGGYDTIMKTMLERAIPIQQAFIRVWNGETHHIQRDVAEKDALIIGYGCDAEEEQDLFRRLIARNASNMLFKNWRIIFAQEKDLEKLVHEEVCRWRKSSWSMEAQERQDQTQNTL